MTPDPEYIERMNYIFSQIKFSPNEKAVVKNTFTRFRKALETLTNGE